jgi:hypothetical protein
MPVGGGVVTEASGRLYRVIAGNCTSSRGASHPRLWILLSVSHIDFGLDLAVRSTADQYIWILLFHTLTSTAPVS